MGIAFFSGAGVFFFSKISKKKKKKKTKVFFQNRFKNIITFPKSHADNYLEIFSIVKTSYVFWSWICLWRFFGQIWEQECFFRKQECFFFQKFQKKKKKKKKKFFFQNRFKNIITFPQRHADNFLEIFPIVKTPYAFWFWICLWRFFGQISEQECFFREQECFFFQKFQKKKKKKKKKKNFSKSFKKHNYLSKKA